MRAVRRGQVLGFAVCLAGGCTALSGIDDKVFDLGDAGAGLDGGQAGGGTGGSGGQGTAGQGTAGQGGTGLAPLTEPDWALRFGDTGSDRASALAVGPNLEIVIAGNFEGQLALGGSCSALTAPTDRWSMFVAKLSATGDCLWSSAFGDFGGATTIEVAVDGQGHVFLVGGFAGTLSLGGQAYTDQDGPDGFFVHLDSSGTELGHDVLNGDGGQKVVGVVARGTGNAVIAGHHERTMSLTGCAVPDACPNPQAGNCDDSVFMASYNGATCASGDGIPAHHEQHAWALALGADGSVVVTGFARQTVNFGGGATTGGDDTDIFVTKRNSDFSYAWAHRWGDTADQRGNAVAVDQASGDVFVSGRLLGTADFGTGAVGTSSMDAFLVRIGPGGQVHYGRIIGAEGTEQRGEAIVPRGNGVALLGGVFEGTVDCGDQPLQSVGGDDIFLALFDGMGSALGCQSYSASQWANLTDVAANGPETLLLFGNFMGDMTFGDTVLSSAGSNDLFLAQVRLQ